MDAMEPTSRIIEKTFRGRSPLPQDCALSAESEAALRQFSAERIMAYGVAYADMIELRGRVDRGEDWQAVCVDLATIALLPPEAIVAPETPQTRAHRLYRAAALTRMGQMMMLSDTPERCALYAAAADLHAQAAALTGDSERVLIDGAGGPVAGWYHGPRDRAAIGGVVVIGGVEGWAMDFAPLGSALADRGVAALVIDGPGQGETRLAHGHVLTRDWPLAYRTAVDELARRLGELPLGFIGNSLGGTVAVRYAAIDPRIRAVCDNGGPVDPGLARGNPTFFRKMVAHCGGVSDDEAQAIWRTIVPPGGEEPLSGPLLVVHGALDPLIPTAHARAILDGCVAPDKTMVVFSDGDHCVYNHAEDKHDLIADWVADRLGQARIDAAA